MLMRVGAARVQMLRTGKCSFAVMTDDAGQATAEAAQEKVTRIRGHAGHTDDNVEHDAGRGLCTTLT